MTNNLHTLDLRYGRNVWLMAGASFFSSLIFQRGIFVLYLLECGLSNTQVSMLQTGLFAANFLMEIPTGIFADRFGRRWSMVVGSLLAIVNAVGMAFCRDFGLFLALFAIEGIGFAFRSGANTALLYDSLKALRREGEYVRIISRITALSSIALAAAMALGGYLKVISWSAVFLLYAASVSIAAVLTLIMFERIDDYRHEPSEEDQNNPTNEGAKISRNHLISEQCEDSMAATRAGGFSCSSLVLGSIMRS